VARCPKRVFVDPALHNDPKRTRCQGGKEAQNWFWIVDAYSRTGVLMGAARIHVTGSQTNPVVGSIGITGGPWKGSMEGTVGENLASVRCI